MRTLTRDDYDALEIADNTRRHLIARSVIAGDMASRALHSYAETVIGIDHAKDLLTLLTTYPDRTLTECLDSMGYTIVGEPDPSEKICYIVTAGAGGILRVFADVTEAQGYLDSTMGNEIVEAPFEVRTQLDDNINADLDMLAEDLAGWLTRYGYAEAGIDVIGEAIRPALPAFINDCMANQTALDTK